VADTVLRCEVCGTDVDAGESRCPACHGAARAYCLEHEAYFEGDRCPACTSADASRRRSNPRGGAPPSVPEPPPEFPPRATSRPAPPRGPLRTKAGGGLDQVGKVVGFVGSLAALTVLTTYALDRRLPDQAGDRRTALDSPRPVGVESPGKATPLLPVAPRGALGRPTTPVPGAASKPHTSALPWFERTDLPPVPEGRLTRVWRWVSTRLRSDDKAAVAVTRIQYVLRPVNLREKPSTKSRVLVVLQPPNEVRLGERLASGWWPVTAQGRSGYVRDLPKLLGSRVGHLACMSAMGGGVLQVHHEPSASSQPVGRLPEGAEFQCGPVSDDGRWIQVVDRAQQRGWVPRGAMNITIAQ